MSFMKADIRKSGYYEVDTCYEGTWFIPADLVKSNPTIDDLRDYLPRFRREMYMEYFPSSRARYWHKRALRATSNRRKAKYYANAERLERTEEWEEMPIVLELKHGWLARLSASGYMDCTEWCAYETEEEAKAALVEMYGTNDDGEKQDWELDL